jgi:hypothetical protein
LRLSLCTLSSFKGIKVLLGAADAAEHAASTGVRLWRLEGSLS